MLGRHLADESEHRVAAGDPTAGCLTADVVVLDALGDGFEVVGLLAVGELPDAQHDRHLRRDRRTAPGTVVQIREGESGSSRVVIGVVLMRLARVGQ